MKNLIRRIVGDRAVANFNFFIRPALAPFWIEEQPFNGQKFRRRIYDELLARFKFDSIVETGTYRGATTTLFAESGLPVWTAESNTAFFNSTAKRIVRFEKVGAFNCDSVAMLLYLSQPHFGIHRPFFYLDAHWYGHLPLVEEVEFVFGHWPLAVVMVDDFRVPGDHGYGYDDYGEGKALTPELLDSTRLPLRRFYPMAFSRQETGARRGCVVLCTDPDIGDQLSMCRTLF